MTARVSYMVEYRTLDVESHDTRVFLDGVNVQIDLNSIKTGDIIQIACKEDVKAPSVKSPTVRLIAPYVEICVTRPGLCCCTHDAEDCTIRDHGTTICPYCVKSWAWDWLIRSHPKCRHGTEWAYKTFGCRCPVCRKWDRDDRIARGVTKGTRPARSYHPPVKM